MVKRMGPGTRMLAATVCRRFYIDGDAKTKIADDLAISRFQVARLLDFSIEQGIVTFLIEPPAGVDMELSEQVRKAFGLQQVVVVTISDTEFTPALIRQRVGAAAAAVLSETVTEHDVLGIAWGRTLSSMASELAEIARCPVVQMGGVLGALQENSLELVRKITAVGHGRPYPVYAPFLLQDAQFAARMRSQSSIAAAIRLFDSITVGAVAVGSWDPPDSQLFDGLPVADREALVGSGVVGEICSSLLRDDGSTATDLESRSIAVTAEQLRHIRDLILVAGGAHKARAVRAAVRAGLGTKLVTDRMLAAELLTLGV